MAGQLFESGLGGLVRDPQCCHDGVGELRGVVDGGEVDEPNAVRERPSGKPGRLDCQAGLAYPARARQRHQTRRLDLPPDLGKLPLAANEAAAEDWRCR